MNFHALIDAQATLSSLNCRSLASIVADLINENEPLLKAEPRGADVLVRERGGHSEMIVTVRAA